MQDLILHPTAATPVPVTHCPPGRSGVRKPRGSLTNPQLREMVKALGLKATTKHIKPELLAMLKTKTQVIAAAQERENLRRKLARAAKAH